MGITVCSPYSGRPVKIRDQDVGRAVRDEENRIFYVLPRASGEGFYTAITRKGGERDEQRYDEMLAKGEVAKTTGHAASTAQIHDATGRRRSNVRGKLVILLLAVIVLILFYLFGPWGPYDWWQLRRGELPTPQQQTPADPAQSLYFPDRDIEDWLPSKKSASSVPPPYIRSHRTAEDLADATAPSNEVQEHTHAPARQPLRSAHIANPLLSKDGPFHLLGDMSEHGKWMNTSDQPGYYASAVTRSERPSQPPQWVTVPGGVKYQTVREGNGRTVKPNMHVTIHYTAKLDRDRKIDSSLDHPDEKPFSFALNTGRVVRGLEMGLLGMRIGEQRRITIPAQLGYGSKGHRPYVPPDATLHFDVELIDAKPGVTVTATKPMPHAEGPVVKPGDMVEFDYAASLQSGEQFDSTHDRGRPMRVKLGDSLMIAGLEQGLIGAAIGETRTLTIPPYLAYAEQGIEGLIPPDATLQFTLTIRNIQRDGLWLLED